MPWAPNQYLLFEEERTRPCRDLADQIRLDQPERIVDLGCGPGNSTAVLNRRYPDAYITGIDSSPDMLRRAGEVHPNLAWLEADIAAWAESASEQYDIVFSNAALHWLPNHAQLFLQLLNRVRPGGALAVQVPFNLDEPAHRLMRELAASLKWRNKFPPSGVREWFVHQPDFYDHLLAPLTRHLNLWETRYFHRLPDVEAITAWYRSTGLRPFLECLPAEDEREAFLRDFTDSLRAAYPQQADGRVLFPFRRLFLIAYR